ncbi:hypothetical protein NQ317_015910 [Molorchus minor]|uniref:MARVEL domain-containing protein n=1 Tax=Molorchus minor TaxID=1323400 RepID=A0ABQ9J226_9CUCU|nr:hypothetical protein NQ317_015910 [Molorchus minor]
MTDPGFPGQHTTTTVHTTSTTVQTSLRFDPSYIRTLPGILKVIQVGTSLIGFICIELSGPFSISDQGRFFNFVSMTAFWFTAILLAFYLFHVIEKLYKVPWLKIEFGFCILWTLFYLIASCLAVTFHSSGAFIAAGVSIITVVNYCCKTDFIERILCIISFGFIGMTVYGIDAYLKLRGVQSGQLAQGVRVTNKQTVLSP